MKIKLKIEVLKIFLFELDVDSEKQTPVEEETNEEDVLAALTGNDTK